MIDTLIDVLAEIFGQDWSRSWVRLRQLVVVGVLLSVPATTISAGFRWYAERRAASIVRQLEPLFSPPPAIAR